MKRTDKDRQDFAVKCAEIESQGGDVLGYIREHWPSYTPGATWFNLQRIYLPNKPMTDGKPKKKGGEEKMRRNRMEQLDGVLEAIRKGEHPYDYLEEQGYVVPMQALSDLKTWARKNAPEKYEQLPSTLRGLKLTRKSIPVNVREEPAPDLKAGESLPVKLPQKDIETVFFGGKPYEKAENADQNAPNTEQKTGDHVSAEDYRKMSGNIREPEKRPQTCCASSTRKGVEVPDELPVCAVKSRVKGEWHLSCVEGCVHLIWEDRITHEERSLGLPADDWKKLASEIPVMLKQLGLAN